jgi:uncharacterized membrane protein YccC
MIFKLDTQRTIHSLKTALACLLGFLITHFVKISINQWIIITILVVMCAQSNVGSVIQKSYMRFLGTLGGSFLSIVTLILFGPDPVAIAATIMLAAILFSYLATGNSKFNEAGTLGAATTVIILMGVDPNLITAFERSVEISIGILIAALVSQFIFPIHARTNLRVKQANTIRELRDFYRATLLSDQPRKEMDYPQLDEKIVSSFLIQRKLATDASREVLGKKFSLKHFKNILTCEKEILRSIAFMHYAYETAPNREKMFSHIYTLHEFHEAVCKALEQIANSLENKQKPKQKYKQTNISLPSIEILKKSVNNNIKNYSIEETEYPHAYLFCAEILIAQLGKLSSLIKDTMRIPL